MPCAVLAEEQAAAEAPSWQDAVAELAGERTKAETCVRLLKRNAKDDQATLDRGELSYGEAKGEMDAVIAGLITAVACARGAGLVLDAGAAAEPGHRAARGVLRRA